MVSVKGLLAVSALFAATAVAAEPATLTLASWGGAYGKSQQEAFINEHMARTGDKVLVEDYSGGLAQVRSQVKTGKVTWDVVDLELQDAIRACDEGLLEPFDPAWLAPAPDGTPAVQDYEKGALTKCAVGSLSIGYIIAYNDSKFAGDKPSSVADFFDLKKFPGKRGMKKSPRATLEWALMADGVAPADVYEVLSTPAGIDRALRKLDQIKDSIVWWEAGAQAPQLLASGEVAMTTAWNGRIHNANQEGKDFRIVWDHEILDSNYWVIPKGAKNQAGALAFIQYAIEPKMLAGVSQYIPYGPVRKSAARFVLREVAPNLPTSPRNMHGALTLDNGFWADHGDEIRRRFTTWIAQ